MATHRPWKDCHALPNRYDISRHRGVGIISGGILSRMPPRRVFVTREQMQKKAKARRHRKYFPDDVLNIRRQHAADQRRIGGLRVLGTAKMVSRLTGERRL